MANTDTLLPSHLSNVPHLVAFDKMVQERLKNIDFSPCMMYMVDTCSSAALPFLADQFQMSQFRDYQNATTDLERRAIIKQAINKRSYMGTVWIVKQAMAAIGFDPAWLVERCNEGTDPVHGWADFKVAVVGSYTPITGMPGLDLSDLILQYKPVRCRYLGIEYEIDPFVDTFPAPSFEEVIISVSYEPFVDTFDTSGFKYDGAHKYDGSKKYRPGIEDFQCHTIP